MTCIASKQILLPKNIIYEDSTGYISGHKGFDGYWWIEQFVVFPEYRGKRLARKLAFHLPKRCKLLAHPLYNMIGPHLSRETLVNFYVSLGFKEIKDINTGLTFMAREDCGDFHGIAF